MRDYDDTLDFSRLDGDEARDDGGFNDTYWIVLGRPADEGSLDGNIVTGTDIGVSVSDTALDADEPLPVLMTISDQADF